MRWWGVHNNAPDLDFVDEGFIALGWDRINTDLRTFGPDRGALKTAASSAYPHKGPRTFAAWAGIFVRFVYEADEGDRIVHPNKRDKTLNFGELAGPYTFEPRAKTRCWAGEIGRIFGELDLTMPLGIAGALFVVAGVVAGGAGHAFAIERGGAVFRADRHATGAAQGM